MSAILGDCTSLPTLGLWLCLRCVGAAPNAAASAAGGVAGATVAAVALLPPLRSVLALPGEGVTCAAIHDSSWSERTNSLLQAGATEGGHRRGKQTEHDGLHLHLHEDVTSMR